MELTCLSRETVYLDGRQLDPKPSQKRHNHSPTGFMWGYGGSGPAQLALAVMMEMLEGTEWEPDYGMTYDKSKTKRHYQDFKSEVIAKLPQKPCALEFDFWGWYHGEDAEKCIKLLKVLEWKEEDEDENERRCSFPQKCQRATEDFCDCACGGSNHGKQTRLF